MSSRVVGAFIVASNSSIPKAKERLNRENNFPPEIVRTLKGRNFWGKIYRKNRDSYSAEMYKELEFLANEQISDHKMNQWQEFLAKQGKNPLSTIPFWKRINRLRESKRRKKIGLLVVNGQEYSTNREKADLFAENLEKKFNSETNPNFNEFNFKKVEEFSKTPLENKFSQSERIVKEFTYADLVKALKEMNSKTSNDPFGMSNKMLKHTSNITKEKILKLFNQCLHQRRVPNTWKFSEVSMLLKPGQDSSNLAGYRPISMTPCLARLFERLIKSRLQEHLKRNNIIIKNQSGFRQRRQTKDNLLYVVQSAQEGFNKGEKTLAIFFDVAAAFDKVWHEGLIYKLFLLKIPYYLLCIIKDFLNNRTFVVKIEESKSEVRKIGCGVPQGGVLSPDLFNLYINDVPLGENLGGKALLFADDIVFVFRYKYKEGEKILTGAKKEAELKVQAYLDLLAKWMGEWRLCLAPHKCSQITFSKARCTNTDKMNIYLYNVEIPEDRSPKFLGITFDQRLNFKNHLENINKKITDRMNILRILSYDKNWQLSQDMLTKMYKVLIRSVLDYASVISSAISVDIRKSFEVIQNNALRIVFKKSLLDHVSVEELRDMANIESIEVRHQKLLDRYYERCLGSNNELVSEIFDNYKTFKRRDFVDENEAIKHDNTVNLDLLSLIRTHNLLCLEKEKYPTTLCHASKIIRELIIDSYTVGKGIT